MCFIMVSRALAYIRITRPPNGILMFLAVLVGVLFSESKSLTPEQFILAFVTAYGLNSSSMVVNDYFDVEADSISNPTRPIPAGLISGKAALTYTALLAAAGLLSAALTSTVCFGFAALAYLASFLYNAKLKKSGFVGNITVSFDVVAPFIYGALISDGAVNERVLSFALLAFLSNTGREVIKGTVDVEGDEKREVRTVARVRGVKPAAALGASLYLAAVILSPLPYLLGYVGWMYLPAVLVADIGFTYSAFSVLKDPTPPSARRHKGLTLLWMLVALISFMIGGFFR